jgi:hypothetical protein
MCICYRSEWDGVKKKAGGRRTSFQIGNLGCGTPSAKLRGEFEDHAAAVGAAEDGAAVQVALFVHN